MVRAHLGTRRKQKGMEAVGKPASWKRLRNSEKHSRGSWRNANTDRTF